MKKGGITFEVKNAESFQFLFSFFEFYEESGSEKWVFFEDFFNHI